MKRFFAILALLLLGLAWAAEEADARCRGRLRVFGGRLFGGGRVSAGRCCH